MTAFLLHGLFLLAALPTVHPGGAALRDACSSDAAVVARLAPGAEVKIQFAFSGDLGTCYKVEAADRKGYVLATELAGLEGYERARAQASDRAVVQMIRAEIGRIKEESGVSRTAAPDTGQVQLSGHASPTVAGAIRLLEANQPKEALDTLEREMLRGNRRDPFLLSLAGMAAFQSDQPRRAAEYWSTRSR